MGAKVLVARDKEIERSLMLDSKRPATAAAIMESMVATEAELRALWAELDQPEIGARAAITRNRAV